MKRLLAAGLLFISLAFAQTVPLTRYFPDNALLTLELNDVQGAIEQTGQFGEETIRALTQLAGTSLEQLSRELSQQSGLGAVSNLGIRAVVGSLRDATIAVYTDARTGEPQILAAAKVGQFGPIGRLIQAGVTHELKNPRTRKFREGQFVAAYGGDFWFGMQDGLIFISTNADLLRAYLKRVRGQALPVLTSGTAYKAVMDGVGPGWARYFINLGAASRSLPRWEGTNSFPPRFLAILKTINLHGGAQRITGSGVQNRTLSILNPNGGDPELYKLLTHNPERLELADALPAQSSGVAIFSLDTAGWLDYFSSLVELGDVPDVAEVRQVLSELKGILGNEFGISTTGNGVRSVLNNAMNMGSLSSLDSDSTTAFISSLSSVLTNNIVYAQVKDGPAVLGAIETAIRKQLEQNQESEVVKLSLERIEIAGNPALNFQTRWSIGESSQGRGSSKEQPDQKRDFSSDFYAVAKGNVLWFGSNKEELEAGLGAAVLSGNEVFKTQRWPARSTGLNFALPLRLTVDEVNALIDGILSPLGEEMGQEIPANLRQIAVNYVLNWSGRMGNTFGHATVNGNRLQTYSLNEFRWNR